MGSTPYLLYPFTCVVLVRLCRPKPIMLEIAVVIAAGYASIWWTAANFDAINAYGVDRYGEIARHGGADGFLFWFAYLSPYPHLFDFALGSLAAALFIALQYQPVSRGESRLGQLGLAFAIGGIAITFAVVSAPTAQRHAQIVLGMFFGLTPFVAVLLFCCARYPSWVASVLSRPWMIVGGEVSYSIYLLHVGIVQFVQVFNQFANNAAPPYTSWNTAHAIVTVLMVIAIVIGVSLVSYNLIEVPARRWLRRWLSLTPTRIVTPIQIHTASG
jgi:peptidoglycan/LPS O-acetylase OafA/YrhL